MGTIGMEFLTNVSETIKIFGATGLEPEPTASEPSYPTHRAMGNIGMDFLTNVSEFIKSFGTTETRTPDLLLENLVVLTLLLSFIFE